MVHVDPACIESKITDISNREAEEITQYLRTNYLNEIKTYVLNVPFVKKTIDFLSLLSLYSLLNIRIS